MPHRLHPINLDQPPLHDRALTDRLTMAGLRATRQRLGLARLLFQGERTRHITAEQLHVEAQAAAMTVSLATIYNTLNQFRDAGLLREVVVEAGSTWFDTNIDDHHHFFYETSRRLQDIAPGLIRLDDLPGVPAGMAVARVDVIIRLRDGA